MASADSLTVLSLLATRISHALRTPLGTAAAVVAELSSSKTPPTEALEDARLALRKMRLELDLLRDLAIPLPAELEQVSLRTLLQEAAEIYADLPHACTVLIRPGGDLRARAAGPALRRALLAGLRYLGSEAEAGSRLEMSLEVDEASALITLSSSPSAPPAQVRSAAEAVAVDFRIEAVMLLFIDAVAGAHGGSAGVNADCRRIFLRIYPDRT